MKEKMAEGLMPMSSKNTRSDMFLILRTNLLPMPLSQVLFVYILYQFCLQFSFILFLIVNGIYWGPNTPRLMKIPDAKSLLTPQSSPWIAEDVKGLFFETILFFMKSISYFTKKNHFQDLPNYHTDWQLFVIFLLILEVPLNL